MRLGVISTPGVAYLTKALSAHAGIMISASHNPVADNGIKFFGPDGFKLTDEQEAEIEKLFRFRSRYIATSNRRTFRAWSMITLKVDKNTYNI